MVRNSATYIPTSGNLFPSPRLGNLLPTPLRSQNPACQATKPNHLSRYGTLPPYPNMQTLPI